MPLFDVYPLLDIEIVSASGSRVTDANGVEYLDMYGGHAVISIGHSHPVYQNAICRQLSKIGFYSNSVKISQQEALAERLCRVSGKSGYQLFLCNSGAEANENAMKLASFHTGKSKIVCMSGAFHGRTSLAVAVTDNPSIAAPVNTTEHTIRIPFNDTNALESVFRTQGDQIAGVIVEGIQGVGGIREATSEFLNAIRDCCDKYGAVYIADSVQCGYGRTGQFFSHDIAAPADIYTVAKGMGNGFPVAGVLIAPQIKPKHGMLGTTFGGNHLACAAAIAVLDVMETEGLMTHAANSGQLLEEGLKELTGIEQVRGRGLMIGFDVPGRMVTLKQNLLQKGKVFTGDAKPDTIRLLPALNLTEADAGLFLRALSDCLNINSLTK